MPKLLGEVLHFKVTLPIARIKSTSSVINVAWLETKKSYFTMFYAESIEPYQHQCCYHSLI